MDPGEVARWLPEARGVFDSQDEFDRSIDWEPLFANNPMRRCTQGQEASRVTLMNLRRAVESQERAWRFFQETKNRNYDVVVATRADLLFLDELEVAEELLAGRGVSDGHTPTLQGRLWLPRFHAWGGVNDRFAVGDEELFTHPESEVHGVGLYDGEAGATMRAAFEKNAAAGGHLERLHLYEGTAREVLAWMIAQEGYWESFDFVHLAASGDGPELMADACQACALPAQGPAVPTGSSAWRQVTDPNQIPRHR